MLDQSAAAHYAVLRSAEQHSCHPETHRQLPGMFARECSDLDMWKHDHCALKHVAVGDGAK